MSNFEPRRAEPEQKFSWVDGEGEEHTMAADEEGIVWPTTAEQVRVADTFGLAVARKAMAEEKGKKG
jgi:hypothetical protein